MLHVFYNRHDINLRFKSQSRYSFNNNTNKLRFTLLLNNPSSFWFLLWSSFVILLTHQSIILNIFYLRWVNNSLFRRWITNETRIQLNYRHELGEWWKTYIYPAPIISLENRLAISVIGTATVFTVRLKGSGRAEIGMIIPDFTEEELDIEITDG